MTDTSTSSIAELINHLREREQGLSLLLGGGKASELSQEQPGTAEASGTEVAGAHLLLDGRAEDMGAHLLGGGGGGGKKKKGPGSAAPPALRGAAPSAVAARIAALGPAIGAVLFIDLENAAPFFMNAAVGAARRSAAAAALPRGARVASSSALRSDLFVWVFATAGQATALHASAPLRSLFDEGRVAYSVCDGRDASGSHVFDALDGFLAEGVRLLAARARPSVDFFLVTGDRARGPMQDVIWRHRDGPRAVSRVSPQSLTSGATFFEDAPPRAAASAPAGVLQSGLRELWLRVRDHADFMEGAELRKSAQRFKKACSGEYKAGTLAFRLLLEEDAFGGGPAGVGHGDWKPAGALLADGSQPRLIDFGLSKVRGAPHGEGGGASELDIARALSEFEAAASGEGSAISA